MLVGFNPFRTAVPFWGQTSLISSSLYPKRDCGSKGVNVDFNTEPFFLTFLEPQSRFGDNPLKFQVVCPQNGTAFKWIVPKTGLRF